MDVVERGSPKGTRQLPMPGCAQLTESWHYILPPFDAVHTLSLVHVGAASDDAHGAGRVLMLNEDNVPQQSSVCALDEARRRLDANLGDDFLRRTPWL